MSLQTLLPYLYLSGLGVMAVGWLALLVTAYRTSWKWGVGSTLIPPVGIVHAYKHPQRGGWPLAIVAVGFALFAASFLDWFVLLDLGERDRVVNGRRVVTLTGWDRPKSEYARAIYQRPDTSTLQMANPDVTDDILKAVATLKRLHELDLNTAQVTDAGLENLKGLTELDTLRLAQTSVTDAGFAGVLAKLPALRRIDLKGTKVSRDAAQAWKAEKPGRSVMQ